MSFKHARPSFPRRLGTAVAAISISLGAFGYAGSTAFAASCNSLVSQTALDVTLGADDTATIVYQGVGLFDVTQTGVSCLSYKDVATIAVEGDNGGETVTFVVSNTSLLPTTSVDLNEGSGDDVVVLQGTGTANILDARDLSLEQVDELVFDGLAGNDTMIDVASGINDEDVTFSGGADTDLVDRSHRTGDVGTSMLPYEMESGNENFLGSVTDNNYVVGNSSPNVIRGGAVDDELKGGGGNDTLIGGAGDLDEFWGQAGTDTVSYDNSSYTGAAAKAVTVSLAIVGSTIAKKQDIYGSAGADYDRFQDSIENLVGSSYDDTLTGDDGDNQISGGAGDDTIEGGDGADSLYGSTGDDEIEGGEGADYVDGSIGTDTVSFDGSDKAVTVDLRNSTATGGHATGDLWGNFENVVGSDFDDTLTGSATANSLDGGRGNDLLIGLGGKDTLVGGFGSHDRVTYAASEAAVTVSLAARSGKGGDAEGDILYKVEDLIGSDKADTLIGSSVANYIYGGGGNDRISGGLSGDTIDGGSGSDTVSYADSVEAVTVSLRTGLVSGGDSDKLKSVENLIGSGLADTLVGSDGANVINGGGGADSITSLGGADTVFGATGDDVLNGGDGDDVLNGGGGADALDGGSGTDVAKPGPGKNTVKNCEK